MHTTCISMQTSPSSATDQSGLSGFDSYQCYPTLWRVSSAAGCHVRTRGDRDGSGGDGEMAGGGGVGWSREMVGSKGGGWWRVTKKGEEQGRFCHDVVLFRTLDHIQLIAISAAAWSCCVALRLALAVSPCLVNYKVAAIPKHHPILKGISYEQSVGPFL